MYNASKALLTTKYIQLIDRKKFTTTVLDSGEKAFLVYVAYLGAKMSIYSA